MRDAELDKTSQDHLYRACVGMMVVNRDGLVFVGNRLDMKSDYWQMPQGGIENGEEPLQAMYRELEEETGIRDIVLLSETIDWLRYDLPDRLRVRLWGGRYHGQRQKWFLCGFCGKDDEVSLGTGAVAEFGQWKWQSLMDIVEEAVPFKRDVYRSVMSEFSSQVKVWKSKFYKNIEFEEDG